MTTTPEPGTVPRVAYRRGPNDTPHHSIRCDPAVWEAAKKRAQAEGTTVTAVLVKYLERYGKDYREKGSG